MNPPTPVSSQQDLDALERVGKVVASLAVLTGTSAALIRWLRNRQEKKERRYAERIERIVRSAFVREISAMDDAATAVTRIERQILDNTRSIADLQKETVRMLANGDEMSGLLIDAVRENREWLDDLQNLVDHSFKIDRRSSLGADRRQRLTERLDAIEERRVERRRAADRVRDDFDETRERLMKSADNDRHEVT